MFVVRRENSGWHSEQISDWKNFRWDFTGHGSLGRFQVAPYAPEILDNNKLGVVVRQKEEVMRFVLDANTLKTTNVEKIALYPPEILPKTVAANKHIVLSDDQHLEHHVFEGVGDLSNEGKKYYLSWQSQPGNRDRAHGKITLPSVLLLHEITLLH